MSTGINVIYDSFTRRVIMTEENGNWVLPTHMGIAHFEPGTEPVLTEGPDGSVYLKPNSIIFDKGVI